LGHTFMSVPSTQSLQNVHSKLQIMASVELAGSVLPQASQLGRNSSTVIAPRETSSAIPVVIYVAEFLTLLYRRFR
jgi:hypothetical protein